LQTPPRLEEKGLRKVDLYVFTTLDGRSKNGDSMKRRIISSWLAESRVSAVLIQFMVAGRANVDTFKGLVYPWRNRELIA
jgi:hypothetical protein